MVKILNCSTKLLASGCSGGSQTVIFHCPELEELLFQEYGRQGLCLKAFYRPDFYREGQPLETFRWGGCSLLSDSTRVQNLFAWHSLAPRVFDIVKLNSPNNSWKIPWCFAQVTSFLEDPTNPPLGKKDYIMQKYGLVGKVRAVDGQLRGHSQSFHGLQVDFQTYGFFDREKYLQDLLKRIFREGKPYQPIEELDFAGRRTVQQRARLLKLDEIDFRGKTVLDIGCAHGAFSREACRRGAKLVVGVDKGIISQTETTASQAFELCNWLGFWNIDFCPLALPAELERLTREFKSFDIVLALSVIRHIGGPAPWLAKLCDEVCLVEGHVESSEATWTGKYEMPLRKIFPRVEFLGANRAEGNRPLYRCWKY